TLACACKYPGRIAEPAPLPPATVPGCVPASPELRSQPTQKPCTARQPGRKTTRVAEQFCAISADSVALPRSSSPAPSFTVAYFYTLCAQAATARFAYAVPGRKHVQPEVRIRLSRLAISLRELLLSVPS